MKKNGNDNRFSLIWGSGLLLLVMCILVGGSFSSSVKGTSAAAVSNVCPEGYIKCANEFVCDCMKQSNPSYTYAGKCYYVSNSDATPKGYCNCGVGELITGAGTCNLDGSCNCGSSSVVENKCEAVKDKSIDMPCNADNTCPTVSGYVVSKKECVQANPTCPSDWKYDDFSKKCVIYAEFEESGMGCYSYATEDGKTVYIYGEYATEDGYTYLGTDKCPDSQYCVAGEYFDTTTGKCEDCPKGSYCTGDKKNACPGSNMTSPLKSDSASDCVCEDGTYMGTGGYCVMCPAGYSCKGGKKKICKENQYSLAGASECTDCNNDYVSPAGSTSISACVKTTTCSNGTYYSSSKTADVGGKIKCGEGNFTRVVEKYVGTTSDSTAGCYIINCVEPCDCGDDGDCSEEFSGCWKCGSSYKYGTDTLYASSCTQVDTSHCSSSGYSGCWKCSDGYKYGTNTQYSSSCTQVSSSYCSSGSSPDEPDVPEKPSSSSSSVKPSSSSSSVRPSSSSNVDKNPQTGNIAIFMVWIVAFGAIAYSIYYFKKVREN